jgi:DNA-binding MarR family transcriptional regulator
MMRHSRDPCDRRRLRFLESVKLPICTPDLAARELISRSGMTRRVARLVDEGLVRRANADADARGVVVALTDAGVARLTETAPVHLRGVSKLFVATR